MESWEFLSDELLWEPVSDEWNAALRSASTSGKRSLRLKRGAFEYDIDMEQETQRNGKFDTVRSLRKVTHEAPGCRVAWGWRRTVRRGGTLAFRCFPGKVAEFLERRFAAGEPEAEVRPFPDGPFSSGNGSVVFTTRKGHRVMKYFVGPTSEPAAGAVVRVALDEADVHAIPGLTVEAKAPAHKACNRAKRELLQELLSAAPPPPAHSATKADLLALQQTWTAAPMLKLEDLPFKTKLNLIGKQVEPSHVRFSRTDDAKLGEGGMGAVYRGEFLVTPVAVKICHVRGQEAVEAFHREMLLHASLAHPRIVQLLGACEGPGGEWQLVLPLMPGTLSKVIEDHGARPQPWGRVRRLLLEMAEGLAFLHSKGVVHCDLKPENVLLDQHDAVAISDFGISRVIRSTNRGRISVEGGSVFYGSPEFYQSMREPGRSVTEKSDVFSFCVIAFEFFSKGSSFREQLMPELVPILMAAQMAGVPQQLALFDFMVQKLVHKGWRPDTSSMPAEFQALLRRGWATDPAARPSMEELFHQISLLPEWDFH